MNHEEQYSICPVDKPNPLGWGAEVLEYIGQVWTDLRLLSMQRQMEKAQERMTLSAIDEAIVQDVLSATKLGRRRRTSGWPP